MGAQSNANLFNRHLHPFHILPTSPFPQFTGIFAFLFLVPTVAYMHGVSLGFLPRAFFVHAGFLGLFCTVMLWFTAIVTESGEGDHTRKVQYGLRLGMLLFIVSEVMFFFAFFWSFFHYSLVPSIAVGAVWPPVGTQVLNVWGLPLVNTLLLLASGVTITIAHAVILQKQDVYAKKADLFSWYLFLTILLGTVFLICQGYEYKYGVKFSWRDNIYGSIFFITTGFHGFHVTLGTLFLLYCWVRAQITPAFSTKGRVYSPFIFTQHHHFGFEAAAWYWHFVDVVWLFLFLTIYWWGGA